MSLELRAVQTDEEWAAMHAIRRAVLFSPERQSIDYDENHPDDRKDGNVPHILMLDEQPIAVARLDFHQTTAVLRQVAVLPEFQGKGHGTLMAQLLSEKARQLGATQMRLNSAPSAVGFYERNGWRRETWDSAELVGIASNCVQMVKSLE